MATTASRSPARRPLSTTPCGESLAALRRVDRKPILLAEIAATETGGNKAAWIDSLFAALPANPDIVGFTWFNMKVTAIPIGEEEPVTNDWRINSSPAALAAFRAGVANPRYGEGLPAPS